ncbi:MAG: alpha/beta hydrolase [Pseudomonadales bacterium]|nr:alpha/beta hydrolase [Pseudomonadales bacterium]
MPVKIALQKITHKRITTAYRDSGGPGIPFLIVHGFAGSMLDFEDEQSQLAQNRRVILVDLRGHGHSTNSGNGDHYNFETLTDDLLSFIAALAIDRLDILGHSMGGMVVIRALLAKPELFRSALLMNTAAEPIKGGTKLPPDLYPTIRKKGVEMLLAGIRSQASYPATQKGIDHLGKNEYLRRIKAKLSQMDPEAFIALQLRLTDQQNQLNQLQSLTMPVTILLGAEDKPFINRSRRMHNKIKGSIYVEIAGAAHSPQYENRIGWHAVISTHFERIDSKNTD